MGIRRAIPPPTDRWGPLPPHGDVPRRGAGWRWLERFLFLIAFLGLGSYLYSVAESHLYQAMENRELDAILASAPPPPAVVGTPAPVSTTRPKPRPAPGSVIGRVEIPRLGVSSVVRAGSDARTLQLAVGHIPGTALPGENGNVGLAGHRDTFFRRLRNIKPDDEIRLVTPGGTFVYRVQRTNIVNPRDVWVLDPTRQPTLTLVTCYPFTYIGSAPQRFIVRASLAGPTQTVAWR
jgi:sortase A